MRLRWEANKRPSEKRVTGVKVLLVGGAWSRVREIKRKKRNLVFVSISRKFRQEQGALQTASCIRRCNDCFCNFSPWPVSPPERYCGIPPCADRTGISLATHSYFYSYFLFFFIFLCCTTVFKENFASLILFLCYS